MIGYWLILTVLTAFLKHEQVRKVPFGQGKLKKIKCGNGPIWKSPLYALFFNFCEREHHLDSNPAEHVSLPRRWKRLPKSLSTDEINALLKPEEPENPLKIV